MTLLGHGSLDMTPETQASKRQKKDKLNFIESLSFCPPKDSIKKIDNPQSQEKIFAIHISDKGLNSEYLSYSYNETTKRHTTQLKKNGKGLE